MRLVTLLLLLIAPASQPTVLPAPAASESGVAVYFSPEGGCAAAVMHHIDVAERSVDCAAYVLSHPRISRSLLRAHDRGVRVRVVLDPSQTAQKYSSATPLDNAGIPVFVERGAGLQHNKYLVIDGTTVLTGSFNFSERAESQNDENLLVITGKPEIAAAFAQNFEGLLKRAERYTHK